MRYSAADVLTLLWRDLGTMILIFAVLFVAGGAAAMFLPKTYTARASVIVGLGQEYVYQPIQGEAARGSAPAIEDIVLSEVEILNSEALRRRVVAKVGLATLDPKLASAFREASGRKKTEIEAAAAKMLGDSLGIHAPPKTGAIRLTFRHKNPEAAARILNAVIAEYLVYRKEVFRDSSAPELARQRQAFESRLADANDRYDSFLNENGIGDFPSDKTSLSTLYGAVLTERFMVEARLREAQGRLAGLQPSLSQTPSEIGLQRDIDMTGPARLTALRVERQDLLSRYRADSQPVRDIDAKIAELQQLIASGGANGDKDRRVGANPVWQAVEQTRIQTEGEIASLISRRAELQRQLASITERQQQLTSLEAEYNNLAVERDVLQANVKALATRQEEIRSANELSEAAEDNIRVVERAQTPGNGESLRKIAFIGAFLFAAFTALCAGLLRVFLRPGFASAEVAERTLDIPVLATATMKSR
ncbi:MAG: hypothetical protein K1X35_02510 [Caulobacteraceae bacterium]|nr:hypothetical protein [Caulobacteraceae bacterium]